MAVARNHDNSSKPRLKLAKAVDAILNSLGDQRIDFLYRDRVRPGRTRRYQLKAPQRPTNVEILFTLLGTELKIGRRRLLCPDVGTARFLGVFARLGVDEVAVPYDITQVGRLAPVFETAWQQMLSAFERETRDLTPQARGRVRSLLLNRQRESIVETGAGPQMPEFDRSTRQRRPK